MLGFKTVSSFWGVVSGWPNISDVAAKYIFVLGTGKLHTVREFAEEAFRHVNIHITWEGEGINERGISDDGKILWN